jgi:hypothetical protein
MGIDGIDLPGEEHGSKPVKNAMIEDHLMDRELFLKHLATALRAVTTPRFYETERGFQGELLVELRKVIPAGFLPDQAIIEQEYQKRLRMHGLASRPDIVIHEPFDRNRHCSRRDGNFAVLELKLEATPDKAAADIENLMAMMTVLEYPLGIFLNIASEITHADLLQADWRDRIACFAVSLRNGEAHVVQSTYSERN